MRNGFGAASLSRDTYNECESVLNGVVIAVERILHTRSLDIKRDEIHQSIVYNLVYNV